MSTVWEGCDEKSKQKIELDGKKVLVKKIGRYHYDKKSNTVQCPYYGEMNWSVHKTYESAKNSVDNQFNVTKKFGL